MRPLSTWFQRTKSRPRPSHFFRRPYLTPWDGRCSEPPVKCPLILRRPLAIPSGARNPAPLGIALKKYSVNNLLGYSMVFAHWFLVGFCPRKLIQCPTPLARSSCSCLFRGSRNLVRVRANGIPVWAIFLDLRWCFTFYHGKSPLNHHLGEYFRNFFQAWNKQIQVLLMQQPQLFLVGDCMTQNKLGGTWTMKRGDDLNIYRPVMSNRSPPDSRKVGVVSVVAASPAFMVGDAWVRSLNKRNRGTRKRSVEFQFHKGMMLLPSFSPKKSTWHHINEMKIPNIENPTNHDFMMRRLRILGRDSVEILSWKWRNKTQWRFNGNYTWMCIQRIYLEKQRHLQTTNCYNCNKSIYRFWVWSMNDRNIQYQQSKSQEIQGMYLREV